MNARSQYREAWRQARLLQGASIRSEKDRKDWETVHRTALKLQGVPDWLGWITRYQLKVRESILGNPMRYSLYFHQVRDGVLPRPSL